MRRFAGLGLALLALIAAGFLWTRDRPVAVATEAPRLLAPAVAPEPELVAPVSRTGPVDRERRRFNRYDKDRDDRITRDEYLASRRKAFAKLDRNGDGRVDFDEYAARTGEKFAKADGDGDGVLVASEFATTAIKRRASCVCDRPAR